MYTLDTNAIVYYLKSETAAASVLEPMFAQDIALYVSAITELELYSSPALTDEDISAISQLLTSVASSLWTRVLLALLDTSVASIA
jgi:predicted nucleic acid-binding protein